MCFNKEKALVTWESTWLSQLCSSSTFVTSTLPQRRIELWRDTRRSCALTACRGTAARDWKSSFNWEREKKEKIKTNKKTPQNIWAKIEIQKYWLNRKKKPWSYTKMCLKQGSVTQNGKESKGRWRDEHRYVTPTTVHASRGHNHFTRAVWYITAMPKPCPTCRKQRTGMTQYFTYTLSRWPQWLTSHWTPKTCFRSTCGQLRNFIPSEGQPRCSSSSSSLLRMAVGASVGPCPSSRLMPPPFFPPHQDLSNGLLLQYWLCNAEELLSWLFQRI